MAPPVDTVKHLTTEELDQGLDVIRQAPADAGKVQLIVSRPAVDERVVLAEASLDLNAGLIGDTWKERGSSRTPDGSANPEAQITIMNARVAALVAVSPDRWQLAGDQVYADMDLSHTNIPAGTRLRIGTAVVEVSAHPHTGCAKFVSRFGKEAMTFVNSPVGRELRLRGMNTRVVVAGEFRLGDVITKEPPVAPVADGS